MDRAKYLRHITQSHYIRLGNRIIRVNKNIRKSIAIIGAHSRIGKSDYLTALAHYLGNSKYESIVIHTEGLPLASAIKDMKIELQEFATQIPLVKVKKIHPKHQNRNNRFHN